MNVLDILQNAITEAVDMAQGLNKDPKSRHLSLTITKLEEAGLWLKDMPQDVKEKAPSL